VPRAKLKTALGLTFPEDSKGDTLEIIDGELRWEGQPFRARQLLDWQKRRWHEAIGGKKQDRSADRYALPPVQAVLQILDGLADGSWADAAGLAVPLEIFCSAKVDSQKVCESGWRWGCLARQQADGTSWYRVAPRPQPADVPPHEYLKASADGRVTVDLESVPLETLEELVAISNQQPHVPSPRSPVASGRLLRIEPNLVKLGRMAAQLASWPPSDWLQKNSAAFQQAFEACRQRSGKTILHENLALSRVSDLALKVAVEKALGGRCVSLGDEHLAFPQDSIDDVKRVVTKSGHVVKEV
jgi:hypothetical protein